MERQQALDMALGQIEKQFGKGAIRRLGEQSHVGVEAIPTGALALDLALGIGGLPRGRVVEIFGPESSGKSTLAMHVVAEAQRNGGVCAYIDAEHAMDPAYAAAIGPDPVGERWRVGEIVLYESVTRRDGATYRAHARFPLGA